MVVVFLSHSQVTVNLISRLHVHPRHRLDIVRVDPGDGSVAGVPATLALVADGHPSLKVCMARALAHLERAVVTGMPEAAVVVALGDRLVLLILNRLIGLLT